MSKALGDILREAREKKGMTIEQLAATTKLNISFIEALEAGRRDLLPGNIYLKPFTKTCAEALDLNVKDLYNIIDGENEANQSNKVGNFELADPPKTGRYKLPVVLGLAAVIIVIIYFAVSTKDSLNRSDNPSKIIPAETTSNIREIKWSRSWDRPIEKKEPVVPKRLGVFTLKATDSVLAVIYADGEPLFARWFRARGAWRSP